MSDAGIQPPAAPPPPVPPAPPSPPTTGVATLYGSNDPKVLVRKILDHLKTKTPIDLSAMPIPYIAAMEAAMLTALTRDELAKYGLELRGILRLWIATGYGITRGSGGQSFKVKAAGKPVGTMLIPRISRSAEVKAITEVTIQTGWARDAGEAYTLAFDGAAGCSWLQFVWRQITLKWTSGTTSLQLRVDHGGKAYLLTSDPARPRWTTDALHKDVPFYEYNTTVIRNGNQLVFCDEPSPMEKYVEKLLNGPNPPEITSKFRATAYLVRERDVFYAADVAIDWTIAKTGGKAVSTLISEKVVGRLTEKLGAAHREVLSRQYPANDYFPGDAIGPPLPGDHFEPIDLADPDLAAWPAGQGLQKRFEAAAKIARAHLIEDVTNPPTVASGPKTPGLNHDSGLSAQGETGFLDGKGVYHNPDIPIVRAGRPPKIAILLGTSAFDWTTGGTNPTPNERTKEYTIATLRHEMMHARHAKLAIGWMLRWRDQLTTLSFEQWLDDQLKAKVKDERVSGADYHIVRAALNKGTSPTEIFAWFEGFLTAIPFLPAQPQLSHFPGEKRLWVAAINEIDGCLKHLNLSIIANVFVPGLKTRARAFICGGLAKPEREVLVRWLDVLIDPEALSPQTSAEKAQIANVRAEAKKQTALLKEIRRIAVTCKS